MAENNILVLGAGCLQVPLIKRVYEKGFNPVVVSINRNEPGMMIAKDTIIADFCDEELMLQYGRKYDIIGIVTDQTDLPVRTVAYVSEKMGLPGIGYETACLFTDKYKMREKCRELGIDTLEYRLASSYKDAREFFVNLAKPIILKPINNQGSKGVSKVGTLNELEAKYKEAVRYSRGEHILIEEFVPGEEEFVIEGIAIDGWRDNLVCGDTYYFSIPDVFAPRQRVFPSIKRLEIIERALELNKKIIDGFGLSCGLTHGEYIVSNGKVYLIEIAARGGGAYISSDIIPLMTGFDTTSFIIDIATKKTVDKPNISNLGKTVGYVAFFLPEGEVISVSGIDEIISLPYIHHNNLSLLQTGMKTKRNTDKTSRFFIVIEASNNEEMDNRIEDIKRRLQVSVKTNHNKIEGVIWN